MFMQLQLIYLSNIFIEINYQTIIMKKSVIICCLFLTLGYASSTEVESINPTENYEINEMEGLSLSEFLNLPLEELY